MDILKYFTLGIQWNFKHEHYFEIGSDFVLLFKYYKNGQTIYKFQMQR